jgi:hypothetical protein
MLHWVIEYFNGCAFQEGKHCFEINNQHLIDKIYFFNGKEQYGFYYQNGQFFINNIIYDLKINVDNFKLTPFQSKTGKMTLEPKNSQQSIYSWNIGYRLENLDESYEYKMIITHNNEVFLDARHYDSDKNLIDQRSVQLQ